MSQSPAAMPEPSRWRTAETFFLGGTFVSSAGDAMHTLTAGLLLYRETGSMAAFGAVIFAEQALTFLTQAIAGPYTDRGNARNAAIAAEMVRGMLVCLLSGMLFLFAGTGSAFAWILAMTVVIRVLHPFHRAGIFALTPALAQAGGLARLNSWFSACQQGGQLLGLFAAGLIVDRAGMPAVFLLNGVTFLISAASLLALPPQTAVPGSPRGPVFRHLTGAWLEIFAVLWREPRIAGLLILSTADNVAFAMFNMTLAPLTAERWGGSAGWLSMIAGAFAFGALASSAVVTALNRACGWRNAIILGLCGQALAFALLAVVGQPSSAVTLAVMLGAFNTVSWTIALSTVQAAAPPEALGRIGMLRNGITAIIIAPLVPLISAAAQSGSAASLLIAAAMCGVFVAGAIIAGGRRKTGDAQLPP